MISATILVGLLCFLLIIVLALIIAEMRIMREDINKLHNRVHGTPYYPDDEPDFLFKDRWRVVDGGKKDNGTTSA